MTRPHPHDAAPPRLAGRLLAEAVRASERNGAALRDEPEADAAGRAAGGDIETRIVRRAETLTIADDLRDGLRHVHQAVGWILVVTIVAAAVAGAGAVRAALGAVPGEGSDAPVNFFWVFTSLLGVQSLLLLAWIAIMIVSPGATHVSPIGGVALASARWLAARMERGPHQLAAIRAAGVVHGRGAIARWTLSAISHAAWTAANTGALVLLILLLSTKAYTFNWETTILSSAAYERLTQAIAIVPRACGFPVPSAEQIRATEAGRGGSDPEAARAWSGLLVGSVAVFGFAPRLLLLGLSLSARRRAVGRYRLDTSAPGFHALCDRLMPSAETRGIVDGDDGVPAAATAPAVGAASASRATGPPVIFGLEVERPETSWPPRLHAVRWVDLGMVDARDDRRRVLAELGALTDTPAMTTIVCALSTTPDRGLGAFVESVAAAVAGPVGLVLTGGQQLRDRSPADAVGQRVDDWYALAARSGLPEEHVIQVDLDHLTDASRARLAAFVGAGGGLGEGRIPSRRIEEAFDLIAAEAGEWRGAPTLSQQATLQTSIAALYRHEAGTLRSRLGLREFRIDDVAGTMKDGARRLVAVLPERLQQSPKWLAAGALGGAAGCIAIGALVAPVALVSLPAWTMGGAGLGALLQFARGGGAGDEEGVPAGTPVPQGDDVPTPADAIRAAALFALLLDLQGRDEAEISRVLDRTLPVDDMQDVVLDHATSAGWLDDVRHRYDIALASGSGGAGEPGDGRPDR